MTTDSTDSTPIVPANTVSDKTESFDARETRAAIAEGEEKSPEENLDLDKDYAAAQAMSQGTLSPKEAAKQVAPQHEVAQPEQVNISSEDDRLPAAGGDPADYRELAREVRPSA
ncbi:hypothetical protein [Thermoleptolyngbya sp. M55_K2018_002]|uniref:hypothetical protein n=1 Tax=Thermoleptolyngbya sp. M55_K2018_002 TaxID=2747808 RepID=UPI0019FD55EC|nr:hypothetical protein [Thermoleptolyngbya sp. M55_K2018_002]HIK39640.1 hypothetical protein [Thermoleptolyngbya sp. M55_K2018_002]